MQRRKCRVLQVDVTQPRSERGDETLRHLACEDGMAGVYARREPGVPGDRSAHVLAGREPLVPVVLHAERDAGRNAFGDRVDQLRTDAGDDDRRADSLGELERPRRDVGVGGVEASSADRGRLEATLSQRGRDAVWPVGGVAEPDLDDREPEFRELVESVPQRSVTIRIGVAAILIGPTRRLRSPSPGSIPSPPQDPRQQRGHVPNDGVEDPEVRLGPR